MRKRFRIGRRRGSVAIHPRLLGAILLIGLLSGCYREYRDSNVQSFATGEAIALDGKQLYFTYQRSSFDAALGIEEAKLTPVWGMPPYYFRAVTERTDFIFNPVEHETIDFTVSDPFLLPGSDDPYSDFPTYYVGVYVGSQGTISFQAPGAGNETIADFFSARQISVLPLDATTEGSRVSYSTLPNMLVVTFEDVEGSSVQFIMVVHSYEQVQLPGVGPVYDDDIFITYRKVSESARPGVVGISWAYGEGTNPASSEFIEHFNERWGEVDLTESTDTTSGGYISVLPLP